MINPINPDFDQLLFRYQFEIRSNLVLTTESIPFNSKDSFSSSVLSGVPMFDLDELISELSAIGVVIRKGKSGSVLSLDFRNVQQSFELSIKKLLAFEKLRELYLDGMKISGTDFQLFEKFSKLQTLDLQNTNADDSFLDSIARLDSLKMLMLTGCPVSQEKLEWARKKMIGTRIVHLG